MSRYFRFRLTGRLNFVNEKEPISIKLRDWFKHMGSSVAENKRNTIDLVISKGELLDNNLLYQGYHLAEAYDDLVLPESDTITINLYNDYTHVGWEQLIKINEVSENIFDVDFCVGNKNRDDNLEMIMIMLHKYLTAKHQIVWYDEITTRKLESTTRTISDYIEYNRMETYLGRTIFDFMKVIDEADEGVGDWMIDGLEVSV